MQKICKNCKYFDRITNECSCKKFVYTADHDLMEEDGLGYWDCDSYSAGVNVGKYFGCIHFKRRDKYD